MRSRQAEAAPLVFVDSDVYLDLITKETTPHRDTGEPRWKIARQLFEAVNSERVVLACSALIEAEVTCNGQSRRDSDRIRTLLRGWFNSPSTRWTDVDRFLARDAAELAKTHSHLRDDPSGRGLKSADATHLAAAIRLGCGYLMTHDRGFPIGRTVEGVQVIRPTAVWQATLMDEASREPVDQLGR